MGGRDHQYPPTTRTELLQNYFESQGISGGGEGVVWERVYIKILIKVVHKFFIDDAKVPTAT